MDVQQFQPVQPRTAYIINILRSCSDSSLAARHDSSDVRYRSPLGALPEDSVLTLRVKIQAGQTSGADLILYGDRFRREIPMVPAEKGYAVTVRLPDTAQALWYCFRIRTPYGSALSG